VVGFFAACSAPAGSALKDGAAGTRNFQTQYWLFYLSGLHMAQESFSVLILAAGKATRFTSERPKLLHSLAGRCLGEYVLRTATAAGPERIYMVIGHQAEAMRRAFARSGLEFIEQKEQLGTGHALISARPELASCPSEVLVALVGDAPLLESQTLDGLIAAHYEQRAACTVLTTRIDDPTGYGRIVRSGQRVRAIIEQNAADAAQRKIKEINTGMLCFSRVPLLAHLDELLPHPEQKGEYFLTDLVEIFHRHRLKVAAFEASRDEVSGINDREQLAAVEKILRLRKASSLMRAGVTLTNPATAYIDEEVEIGPDSIIEAGVALRGRTRLGRGCHVESNSIITDSVLGDGVTIRASCVISHSEIGSRAAVGPFAHLREGAVIGAEVRIGNFVEVKKSRIGKGSKAQHLSYLGDATVGERVNIGAGTITCNYDGEKKNPTTIEDEVFIGSGNMLVAPVRVGKGAYTAAGSTITKDVPPESLAIGRSPQVVKGDWARRRKQAKPSGLRKEPSI
jgi:bifunctional UDP-N-acetylglucosamine pyrophosphorylase / glucosamine-1-phosphate N-acetyltransferase